MVAVHRISTRTMLIKLLRNRENAKSTVGELVTEDGQSICVTLEDAHHDVKIPGGTRIPKGMFPVKLRTEGGFHARYLKRFGADFHKGMLWIRDVPGFEYILVHCGNTIADTDGCVLTGSEIVEPDGDEPFEIIGSEKAYRKFYPPVRDALLRKEPVWIQVIDPVHDDPLVA